MKGKCLDKTWEWVFIESFVICKADASAMYDVIGENTLEIRKPFDVILELLMQQCMQIDDCMPRLLSIVF